MFEKRQIVGYSVFFRWFPVMVLSVCRAIKAHRIIAGIVFWAMFIGLCVLTVSWMRSVASGGEPVMDGAVIGQYVAAFLLPCFLLIRNICGGERDDGGKVS